MTLKARESALPGIGYKVELETRSGDKLVIVTHDDGRRELYGFYPDNPDESIAIATLRTCDEITLTYINMLGN
ncbi:MAG: hypothetical protein M3511_08180 [Deinococcota bacterium]|nr:hypothetical protein [Deinococcota bacterium]